MAALEANLAAIDEETTDRFERQDDHHGQLREHISALTTELWGEQEALGHERREQLRESMAWQWIGTGLFLIGAILAGVANGAC